MVSGSVISPVLVDTFQKLCTNSRFLLLPMDFVIVVLDVFLDKLE